MNNNIQPTNMQFSIYDFHKENTDVSTNHSQLVKRFKDTVLKLSEEEQSTISWEVKKFFITTEQGIEKSVESIFMDKDTALWFASLVNHSLRLRIIKKLSTNEPKTISKSDVYMKIVEQNEAIINMNKSIVKSLEDDTKQIEAPIIVEEAEKTSTRYTVSHNTESKYYNLKRTNLRDLPLDDPIEGVLCFEYYNESECILYAVKRNRTYKIPLPSWMKEFGTWSFVKANIKFIRTPKTGKFALVSVKEKR